MPIRYTASSLADIATLFETGIKDNLDARAMETTDRGRRECEVRAQVWKEAAEILRNTTLEGQS